MKAQGLPITTIVIIVMVIVVLAAVLIFFFGGFSDSGKSISEQTVLARCQAECTKIASGVAKSNTAWDDPFDDGDYDCDNYMDVSQCTP